MSDKDVSENGRLKYDMITQFPEKLAMARTKTKAGQWVDVLVWVDKLNEDKADITPLAVIVDKGMFDDLVDPQTLMTEEKHDEGTKV